MGQQQLLLIVLTVIVVGISVAVGIQIFRGSAQESNRGNLISYCVTYASRAQLYFRTSREFGGGAQNFDKFHLSPYDTSNGYGAYSVTATAPSGANPVPGNVTEVTGSSGTIYVVGTGVETGDDGSNPVKAYVRVTSDSLQTIVLN